MSDPSTWNDETKRLVESMERFIREAEEYFDASWKATAIGLEDSGLIRLFAIGRAYYAVYNCCLASAMILDIDVSPFQAGSSHHRQEESIPHSQLPVLASHLVNLMKPSARLGEISPQAVQAFETCRVLQTYRKTADYMGCERVSHDTATECIKWARTLVETIWEYTREQWSDRRARL